MDNKNISKRAFNGEQIYSDNLILRQAYWALIGRIVIEGPVDQPLKKLTYSDWVALIDRYVLDPKYQGKTRADPKDRAQRIRLGLSGGNTVGVEVEMSWRRFMEALVILNVSTFTMVVEVTRGNHGATASADATTRPSDEHLKLVTDPAERYREAVSVSLARYFSNPEYTAIHLMRHTLLKILWKLIARFKIDLATWNRLSTQYVRMLYDGEDPDRRRNDKRNNLQSMIRSTDRITWKRFLEVLKAFDGRTMECTFRLDFEKQPTVEHTFTVDLPNLVLGASYHEPE